MRAETETVDGYTWKYQVDDDGNVTIGIYKPKVSRVQVYEEGLVEIGIAISPRSTGAITIPSVLGGKPLTRIGGRAFEGCEGLTSVTIPASVTNIEEWAFDENTKVIRETKVQHEAGDKHEIGAKHDTGGGDHESKLTFGFASGFLWGMVSSVLLVVVGGGAWWAFRRVRKAGGS